MSQAVIDAVIAEWDCLFSFTVDCLATRVRGKLISVGIDPGNIEGFSELFSDLPRPFSELETVYKQNKYYKENMGLVVSIILLIKLYSYYAH